ncbi:MAG: superoxide dismutase, Ni [Pirellulales bacterium]|nr:superoxide dismutase, Ni [Pirellulales bacterium]
MKKVLVPAAVVCLVLAAARTSLAHCEVPCGIFADQRRFEQLLEDQATITKGITNIIELSAKNDPKSKNQLIRWVVTKEEHAKEIQHTIAQYFMAQRIKTTNENYNKQLLAAHAVMVAAMKTKQDANPETAVVLRKAILDLYRAYEGKEPKTLDHTH